MRVREATAHGFGPFVGDKLELAPGMNVICGPNESGKSSWHAALYAALCGMRRARGRANREDQDFTNRHKPWRGGTWRVSAVVDLDDGSALEIDQRLGRGGRSTARDLSTHKQIAADLERQGAVDVAGLLGLTREVAVATIFVRQADVLRVLSDASALQEFLERAAATSVVDTTADEALARIASYTRDRVGIVRAGAQGPLATALRGRADAESALDDAEQRRVQFLQLQGERQEAEGTVAELELVVAGIEHHERERSRLAEWQQIRALERQLDQVETFRARIAAFPGVKGADPELTDLAARTLVAFETRQDHPAPLDGPTAEQIEATIASLPTAPEGDREPLDVLIGYRDDWHGARQQLASHVANEPAGSADVERDDAGETNATDLQAELDNLPVAPQGDVEPEPVVTHLREQWRLAQQDLVSHVAAEPPAGGKARLPDGDGATVADIEAELEALPAPPHGDVEPNADIFTARDEVRRRLDRLEAHAESRPDHDTSPGPPTSPAELRKLADDLELVPPAIDGELRAEVEARRAASIANQNTVDAPPSAGRSTALLAVGAVLAVVGGITAAAGLVVPGSVVLVIGLATAGGGLAMRSARRAKAAPTEPNAAATAELQRLEARLLLEEESASQVERRKAASASRLAELGLDPEPTRLREIAASAESTQRRHEEAQRWEKRADELRLEADKAEDAFRHLVQAHGTGSAADETYEVVFERYVEACRVRAGLAQEAGRRGDLEARLTERRAVEQARVAAVERHRAWEERRMALVEAVDEAHRRLADGLAARGTAADGDEDLEVVFERYVEACRERAGLAQEAGRRGDLEARLTERRAVEEARAAAVERHRAWEERRMALVEAVDEAHRRLADGLAARGTAADGDEDLEAVFERYVEACRERVGLAQEAGRRGDLEARLAERRSAEANLQLEIDRRNDAERTLVALSERLGCSNGGVDADTAEASVRAWLDRCAELADQVQARKAIEVRLDQLLDGRTQEQLQEEVTVRSSQAGLPPSEDDAPLPDREADLVAAQERHRYARDRLAELVGQLEAASEQLPSVSGAVEADARAEAEVRRIETLSGDLDRATAFLTAAQQKVHADIAPVLEATLRPWAPRVTLGRYDDLRVDPASLEVQAHESGGSWRPATLLSQGTTEQLFLLLRLALAEHLTTTGESTPLVLDDVTVQSDSARTVGLLELLHEVSHRHQVILFSQEDEVLDWATANLVGPNDSVVRLSAIT